jgi:trk system potassium uptake protein TrkA
MRKKLFYIFEGQTLAYALAKKLLLVGNEVFYISKDIKNIEVIDGLKAFFPSLELIHHDPTDINWVQSLDMSSNVGAVIVISEDDALNFVITWMIRQLYDDIRVIVLVNHPENEFMFKALRVNTLTPISWMQKLIESFLNYDDITAYFNPYIEKLSILELMITKNDNACNKILKDLNMPGNSIIGVIIKQDGSIVVPKGNTVVHENDKLLVLAAKEQVSTVKDILK